MKILVTGFEPFGGENINPSIEAVQALPDRIEALEIYKIQIPVVRYKALECIKANIGFYHPQAVISVGQAGGRANITPERIGINCDDYRICDNAGNQPVNEKIFADGPDAYFSSLPYIEIVERLKENGIPASVSNTAGTFVCNHVLYGIRHYCTETGNGIISGFIHVPYLDEQVKDKPGVPSMSLTTISEAIRIAAEVTGEKCI